MNQPEEPINDLDPVAVRAAARILGSKRSDRKAAASRANGRKGGRPPRAREQDNGNIGK